LVHIFFAAEAWNKAEFVFNEHAVIITYKGAFDTSSCAYLILLYLLRFQILYISIHSYKDRVLSPKHECTVFEDLLQALPKLLLVTISFIMSVRPRRTRLSLNGTL
jgi:hypothetical protein